VFQRFCVWVNLNLGRSAQLLWQINPPRRLDETHASEWLGCAVTGKGYRNAVGLMRCQPMSPSGQVPLQ